MIDEKIAPQLRMMIDDQKRMDRSEFSSRYGHLGVVADATSKPERVNVFLHCDDDADFAHLVDEGIRVNQATGTIRTAFLPIEQLGRLSDEPAVKRIEPTQQLRLQMDVAAGAVQVPLFRQATQLTGRNVIIGIIDSGIQYRHPAFRIGVGSKVLRIWDQVIFGPGVPEGRYGAELTGQLRDVSRDGDGHGTHVAGIAAGNGPVYGGVAPDARLIIVKTDGNEGRMTDAIKYIFRVANELDRPAVVNISMGGHFGPHDGSDSFSQLIDTESGPGRIVCVAAGNDGARAIHAQTNLGQDQITDIRFEVPEDASGVLLNGWFSGKDKIEIALRSPEGLETAFHRSEARDIEALIHPGSSSEPDRVRSYVASEPWMNGDLPFGIWLFPRPRTTTSTWTVRLRGTEIVDGQVNIWVQARRRNQGPLDSFASFLDSVHDGMKIGEPGAAARAVTVASYTTRVSWTSVHGRDMNDPGLILRDISSFSSDGPLRKGQQKPDVAAPGAWIVSALSADSEYLGLSTSETRAHFPVNPDYLALSGTSMATPFITGLVALLLEHNPNLDPEGAKKKLAAISSILGQPIGTFDPKWGYGLINAETLSQYLSPNA